MGLLAIHIYPVHLINNFKPGVSIVALNKNFKQSHSWISINVNKVLLRIIRARIIVSNCPGQFSQI